MIEPYSLPELREKITNSEDVDGELVKVQIEDIYVIDTYVIYSYRDDIYKKDNKKDFIPTVSLPFPDKKSARKQLSSDKYIKPSIRYEPRVSVKLNLPEGTFHYRDSSGIDQTTTFTNILINYLNNSEQDISTSTPFTVLLDKQSDDYGVLFMLNHGDIVKTQRRLFNGLPQKENIPATSDNPQKYTTDTTRLYNYVSYHNNVSNKSSDWIKSTIKSIALPDTNELPIFVQTPMREAKFTFTDESGYHLSYKEFIDEMNPEKYSDLENKTVYIRESYKKYYDNKDVASVQESEYTINESDSKEWELSIENPDKSTKSTSNMLTTLKDITRRYI